MKGVFNGLLIALSMYSKIPVPQAEWNERNMRYALCFFPLVGAVIGGIGYGLYYLFDWLGMPPLLIAAFVVLLPIWTGSATRWTPSPPASRASASWKF